MIPGIFWVVLIGGGIGILFALVLTWYILRAERGTAQMQDVEYLPLA